MVFRHNKPARLGKTKPNDNSYDDHDQPNLKSPLRDSIQVLSHQQLVTRSLLNRKKDDDPSDTTDAPTTKKKGLGLLTSSSALQDNAKRQQTVNSLVSNIESKIDVAQAINLLQELKKSASPDELVALHRALLPMKEDTPPLSPSCPQLPPIGEHAYTSSAPTSRTKSAMLPGLATRSGVFDDLLRKPSDPPVLKTPTHEDWKLDWPDRISDGDSSPTRLGTPGDHSWHAGAFQTGTLRITNGAASPEPSIITKLADAAPEPKQSEPEYSMDIASKSMTTLASTILGDDTQEQSGGKQLPELPEVNEMNDPPTPCPSKERPMSTTAVEHSPSSTKQQLLLDRPLQRQTFQGTQSPSPSEAPRFQQRWDHRASHLSREYIVDCELSESPQEEKLGLFDFATRLSTVLDDDAEDEEEAADAQNRTFAHHARTLSKLTGDLEVVPAEEDGIGAARTSDEQHSSASKPPPATQAHVVRKMDSGYCSDDFASTGNQQGSTTSGSVTEHTLEPDEAPTFSSQEGKPSSTGDSHSLYTFDEVVKASQMSDAAAAASPDSTAKKSSPFSLFKSKSRRPSFKVLNVEHGSNRMGDGPARMESFESSTETDTTPIDKRKKKLQKPMPDSVRHQRKKTASNLRSIAQSQATLTPARSSISTPPSGMTSDAEGERGRPSTSTVRPETSPSLQPTGAAMTDSEVKQDTTPTLNEKQSSSWLRKRSRSFARKRSKTFDEPKEEVSNESPSASTPVRKRSKSAGPSHRSVSQPAQEAERKLGHEEASKNEAPYQDAPLTPTHTSFASVARALSSHPPSPQQPEFTPSPPTRSSTEPQTKPDRSSKRYYSLHRMHDEEPHADRSDGRPDCASPEPYKKLITDAKEKRDSQSQPPMPVTPVAVGSNCSVEDRFPGWQGKPASQPSTPDPSAWALQNMQRLRPIKSRSFAEGIPPLPELPADIATKVSKAEEMVAKKLKTSPRSSPLTSARSSIDSGDTRKATVIRNAARKEQEARVAKENRMGALEMLSGSPGDQLAAPLTTPQGHIQRWSIDGSIELPRPQDQAKPASPNHDSQHPGWPAWDKQSTLWRQRRQALVGPRSEPKRMHSASSAVDHDQNSPSIVVSRYITPLAAENAHNAHNANQVTHYDNNSAEEFAQSYSDLISADKENLSGKPDFRRADSVVSSATFVTISSCGDMRPAKFDIPRTGSAISSYTTTSHDSEKGPTPPKHGRSKSYYAYKPSDAARAERSRALSLARRSHHASKESLDAPPERPELKQRNSDGLFDRYSGGFGYGWDRNSGFEGSAGMRTSGGSFDDGKRKSVKMSEEYGLDLSDVPVFLRRV